MQKKLPWISAAFLVLLIAPVIALSFGGAGPPPPPPVPDPGIPVFGPRPEIGKPFNFAGIVASAENGRFSLVDRWFYLPGEPPVLQEPSLIVNVGETTQILRDSLNTVSGTETVAFSDIRPGQLLSASGIITAGNGQAWQMEAAVITIQKDDYLALQ